MIDYKEIQPRLDGMWNEILSMYGIDVPKMRGINTINAPCPLCGGSDRAHWREQSGRLALYCRHCTDGSMKSPENVIMEATHTTFDKFVEDMARFINHAPPEKIQKARVQIAAQPKNNMPIDHKQDHELVERFIATCEWRHSIWLLGQGAPNPQKLPSRNDIDYWIQYNESGVAVNLVKYIDYVPHYLAGGISYGCIYTVEAGKRQIAVVDAIDGICCYQETLATVHIAFSIENLRYCIARRKDFDAVICVRTQELYDEFKDDGLEVRLLTGTPFDGFTINK